MKSTAAELRAKAYELLDRAEELEGKTRTKVLVDDDSDEIVVRVKVPGGWYCTYVSDVYTEGYFHQILKNVSSVRGHVVWSNE